MGDHFLPLRLLTLGPPEVYLGEDLVPFSTRKTLALLIYLAIETGAQPREHLAALFWPESNPERSHASLRNTLAHLQLALRQVSDQTSPSYLSTTHNSLGLNPAIDITLDLQLVERAYASARADRSSRLLPEGSASLSLLQSAVACQRGEFLMGFSLPDSSGFDDWVVIQREVWHRRMDLIFDRLSEIQYAHGEFAGAAETAARWITLDTLNEVAYRRQMRAYFAAGERGHALETYEACRSILAAELGIGPDPDTIALAERIRIQTSPLHYTHRPTSQPQRPETSVDFLGNLFAGRTSEYQTLVKCYKLASAGQPQLVVLRGEAGIGKTRLARKFLAWVSEQEADVLQGTTFESGSHVPFQPLVEALRLLFQRENSPVDLLDEVWLAPLSQLLPELHESHPDLATVPDASQNKGEKIKETRLFEPFSQLTMALANRKPLVLFLDDLQWIDSATLDLLQYAVRRWKENRVRILFLASLRSEALHPMTQPRLDGGAQGLNLWLEGISRDLKPVHIELEPLGEQETVQMVLSILSPPVPAFAQWLYVETSGQPYYLIETLKDLLERRLLHPRKRSTGQWSFALDVEYELWQSIRIPSTVQAVIRSRLNRLSPIAFGLLAGGAVLEHRLTFEHLCYVSSISQDQALPALDELLSGRLLLETSQPGKASAYIFINDMMRDVVYTEAGDARRRLFHQRAFKVPKQTVNPQECWHIMQRLPG